MHATCVIVLALAVPASAGTSTSIRSLAASDYVSHILIGGYLKPGGGGNKIKGVFQRRAGDSWTTVRREAATTMDDSGGLFHLFFRDGSRRDRCRVRVRFEGTRRLDPTTRTTDIFRCDGSDLPSAEDTG